MHSSGSGPYPTKSPRHHTPSTSSASASTASSAVRLAWMSEMTRIRVINVSIQLEPGKGLLDDGFSHRLLAHFRQRDGGAVGKQESHPVRIDFEPGVRLADVVGDDHIQVLALDLGRCVFEQILRLSREADHTFWPAALVPPFSHRQQD